MKHWSIKCSLFINYGIFAVLLNSVGTVILQVQNSYGVSASSAATLEAFKDLSIAVTCFLTASFISRVGYKLTMLIAMAFIAVMCIAMPQLPAFWMNKLMFAAIGFSFALIKVSVFATLGLVTDGQRQHVSLMNFIEAFFMVAVLAGFFLFSGFIDDSDPGSTSWLNVYYVLAGLAMLAFALLYFAKLDESQVIAEKTNSGVKDFVDMLRLTTQSLVMIFVLCAFLYVLIEQSIMSWLPTFNNKILNLSPSLSVQVASILAASTALGRFVAGFVLKKFDWYRVLSCSVLIAGLLVIIALPLAASSSATQVNRWLDAPLAAFLFPLIGLCLAPIYPAINSIVLSALPKRDHASMAGLIVVFSALGGTTGSLLTGTLFQYFGGTIAFYCSLVPIVAILLSLYWFKRRVDERQNERFETSPSTCEV